MFIFAAEAEGGGLAFPSLDNLINWAPIIDSIGLDKIGFTHVLGLVIPTLLFMMARGQDGLIPTGVRNFCESIIDFIEDQIITPAIGPDGMSFLPLLLSFFVFVFFGNITEVIPFFQMPANGRMGGPVVVALVSWAVFNFVGFKTQGFGYLKDIAWPSSVPIAIRPLVGLIEILSVFLLRPFSHAVRLFANMLAGHILLVTFSVLTIAVFGASLTILVWPFAFGGLIAFTAFEIFVSFIQAFVFTILAAVYIGGSLHPAH